MKHILPLLTLSFLLISCGQEDAPSEPKEEGKAADTYPLTTCVVTGEKLGSHGDPHVIQHEGTTVKFCCEPCVDDFNKDPAKYLAKLAPKAPEPAK